MSEGQYPNTGGKETGGSSPDGLASRPAPERLKPIRTLQAPGSGSLEPPAVAARVVAQTVELGYRVVEDYLRAGEEMARMLGGGMRVWAPANGDNGRGAMAGGAAGVFGLFEAMFEGVFAAFSEFAGGRQPAPTSNGFSGLRPADAAATASTSAPGSAPGDSGRPPPETVPCLRLTGTVGETVSGAVALDGSLDGLAVRCSPLAAVDGRTIVRSVGAAVHPGALVTVIVSVPAGLGAGLHVGCLLAGDEVAATVLLEVTI